MFTSLILAFVIIAGTTALIGISSIGQTAFKESVTLTEMNATVWTMTASCGALPIAGLFILIIALLLGLIGFVCLRG